MRPYWEKTGGRADDTRDVGRPSRHESRAVVPSENTSVGSFVYNSGGCGSRAACG